MLFEVGIVITVSPRRNKLKETEGPDMSHKGQV